MMFLQLRAKAAAEPLPLIRAMLLRRFTPDDFRVAACDAAATLMPPAAARCGTEDASSPAAPLQLQTLQALPVWFRFEAPRCRHIFSR